jgi:hypothetical protein
MTAALPLTLALALAAAPVLAAGEAAAPKPGTPLPTSPSNNNAPDVPEKDTMPNPGSDGGVTPYALKDFDEVIKADLKRLENDSQETLKSIDAQYEAQKALESGQLKEKFEFLKKLRDERAAFERSLIDDWKKFAEKLRATEPAERGTEKLAFDQKSMERRHKFEDEQLAKNKEFMEKQQRDRDAFWVKTQKDNNERSRQQLENATKWGKVTPPR